ncbi:MAG: fasciclin domain-containing protein, partial [Marmoricola sp.]|nr:fasciclin domain-containing protein [Marmoricola sp.]
MQHRRTLALAATATAALLSLSACGSSSSGGSSSSSGTSGSSSSSSMTPSPSSTPSTDAAAADLVGPGCAAYAKQVPTGAGSVDGMAQSKVAEAASANPLLTTLVAAVSGKVNPKVNLVPALDGGQYTVFAPVDAAFAKMPKATLAALSKPAGAKTLSTILEYHVVKGQIAPSSIDGMHKTLIGQS